MVRQQAYEEVKYIKGVAKCMNAIRMHIEPLWQARLLRWGTFLLSAGEGCKGAPV